MSQDEERSDLAALPPQDPRGKRLRRWIPLTLLLAGLAVMGLLIRFVLEESPSLEPKKSPASSATGTSTNHIPSALSELSEAAKRRDVSASPPGPSAREQELARQLAELTTRLNAMEAPPKVAPAPAPAPVLPASKPNPQADAEAKRRATEEAKAAKELARKKREDDAAAKRGRLIWERKSDKSEVGAVKTLSEFSLAPGWIVPCVLKTAISNRASGPFTAIVRQNVYDSATGNYLIIPANATLIGSTEGGQVFGDTSLRATVNKMVVGRSIYQMGNSGLQDVTGRNGLQDQYDQHWGRAIMSVLLTSVLRGSTAATRSMTDNIGQQISSDVARDTASMATQKVQQFVNLSPTIEVRQGYPCNMVLSESLSIPKPFNPVDAQRDAYRARNGW